MKTIILNLYTFTKNLSLLTCQIKKNSDKSLSKIPIQARAQFESNHVAKEKREQQQIIQICLNNFKMPSQ